MKRIASLILAAALSLSLCLPASASARVVNYALYTDIAAKIDGHPLRSYNIGGYTAVVAEDLRGYGFDAIWDGPARTLRVTRALRGGEPETPAQWPDYAPGKLTHRVGSRAKSVYATDIVTYVAGNRVESFNIDGETLVWMDDLAPFGSVVWNEETRVIELTLGDPVSIAIGPLIANVESWRSSAGPNSRWETWECPTGTLLLTSYAGTPHGSMTSLLLVKKNGEKVRVNDLLPSWPWGVGHYLHPSDIEIDEAGELLTFVTPVREALADGSVKEWGDTLCTVNLRVGTLESMQPLAEELTSWSVQTHYKPELAGSALSVTLGRVGASVEALDESYPGEDVTVNANQDGITVVHYAGLFDGGFADTDYGRAYAALDALGLPDPSKETDGAEDSPALREAAARYFRVTLNGEPVGGSLRWGHGNNHVDLEFFFDAPLALRDGDTLNISLDTPHLSE